MDVSIVIISYNVSDLLNDCIVSIKKETSCNYEIIVVDNNSKDNSAEMLKTCHPDVRLIQNEMNVGFAKANNQAFKEASGKYILMLNPDTVVLNKAIDKLVQFMDEYPDAGAAGCKLLYPDMSLHPSCRRFTTIWSEVYSLSLLFVLFNTYSNLNDLLPPKFDYNKINEVDYVWGACMILRGKAIERVGMLDERYFMYAEEQDWCFQAKKAGWKIYYIPDGQVIHIGGASSSRNTLKLINPNLYKSIYLMIKKNRSAIASLSFKWMLVGICLFRSALWFTMMLLKPIKKPIYRDRIKNSLNVARLIASL